MEDLWYVVYCIPYCNCILYYTYVCRYAVQLSYCIRLHTYRIVLSRAEYRTNCNSEHNHKHKIDTPADQPCCGNNCAILRHYSRWLNAWRICEQSRDKSKWHRLGHAAMQSLDVELGTVTIVVEKYVAGIPTVYVCCRRLVIIVQQM